MKTLQTQLDPAPKVIHTVSIYELTQKDIKNINKIRYMYKFLTSLMNRAAAVACHLVIRKGKLSITTSTHVDKAIGLVGQVVGWPGAWAVQGQTQ